MIDNSILLSIKDLLGLNEEQKNFDNVIIIHINKVFKDLNQLGVGPEDGFSIKDDYTLWTDYISDTEKFNDVITYMYLKVKLLFDPPLSSTVIASMERMASECEWRLNVEAENAKVDEEEK